MTETIVFMITRVVTAAQVDVFIFELPTGVVCWRGFLSTNPGAPPAANSIFELLGENVGAGTQPAVAVITQTAGQSFGTGFGDCLTKCGRTTLFANAGVASTFILELHCTVHR